MSEDELLRTALAPVEPPPGFQERVLRTAKHSTSFSAWGLLRLAAMAVVVLALGASYFNLLRRAQNERHSRQVLWALQLTSIQMAKAGSHLRSDSRPIYLFPISRLRSH